MQPPITTQLNNILITRFKYALTVAMLLFCGTTFANRSPQFKINMHGSSTPAKDSIVVTLKPKNTADEYSGHNNFMDSSTFQYHPAFQIPTLQKLPKLDAFALGSGNGYEIAKAINDYVLIFTNN